MGRILSCSDLHGSYELWEKIKKELKDDDHLYFLGDAADRGVEGYQIIKELLNDPRVTYLKGNHEQFFIDGCISHLQNPEYVYASWVIRNGGQPTFKSWLSDTPEEKEKVLNQLVGLPECISIFNENQDRIYLSHAGFTPGKNEDVDLLWDRNHFYDNWPDEEKNSYIVHGHTPTPILMRYLSKRSRPFKVNNYAVRYAKGHKWCIDAGGFATGVAILMDLNTFEPTPIIGSNFNSIFWEVD